MENNYYESLSKEKADEYIKKNEKILNKSGADFIILIAAVALIPIIRLIANQSDTVYLTLTAGIILLGVLSAVFVSYKFIMKDIPEFVNMQKNYVFNYQVREELKKEFVNIRNKRYIITAMIFIIVIAGIFGAGFLKNYFIENILFSFGFILIALDCFSCFKLERKMICIKMFLKDEIKDNDTGWRWSMSRIINMCRMASIDKKFLNIYFIFNCIELIMAAVLAASEFIDIMQSSFYLAFWFAVFAIEISICIFEKRILKTTAD